MTLSHGMAGDGFGYRMLISMLQAGFQESNRIIEGFNDKAKSTITVAALVLSVIVAGTRVSFGLAEENGIGHIWGEQLVPVVGISVSALLWVGIIAIIVSIVASLVSIVAVRIKSPFSSNLVVTRGMLDPSKIEAWSKVSRDEIYKRMFGGYAEAMVRRENIARWSGRTTLIGQISLGAGVVLAAIASTGIFWA